MVAGASGEAAISQPGEQGADVMGLQLDQLQVAQVGQGVPQQLLAAVEGKAAAPGRVQGAGQVGPGLLLGGAVEGATHPLAGLRVDDGVASVPAAVTPLVEAAGPIGPLYPLGLGPSHPCSSG